MTTGQAPTTDLDEATERLAAGFIACIEAGDAERMAEFCTDDVVIWHNEDDREVPLDAVIPRLLSLHRNTTELRYDNVRRRASADGYVQQHVLRAHAPFGELALAACLVVTLRDGLIARLDEYFDTAAVAPLRRPGSSPAS